MDKLGLKETNEILDGLEILTVTTAKIIKDGKVDFKDLEHLPELALSFGTLSDAVDNASGAVLEAKDLDQAEVLAIISRVYAIIKAFEAAKK